MKNKNPLENGPWARQDFKDGSVRYWEFGKLRLWIRKAGKEWQISSDYYEVNTDGPKFADPVPEPPDTVWDRFVTGDETILEVKPILPDRPIIVRPEYPLKIMRGSGADFFLHVPVWLQAHAIIGTRSMPLAEYPSEHLSSSWFGDMKTGELCYSYRENLRPQPIIPPENCWTAVCPLVIRNTSQSALDFQRFCVRCVHLSLYIGQENLFTNEIQVRFSGEEQVSQVVFSPRPPDVGEPLQVIAEPRAPTGSILKKSFSFLKTLTDM